jgi:hypothetical protein
LTFHDKEILLKFYVLSPLLSARMYSTSMKRNTMDAHVVIAILEILDDPPESVWLSQRIALSTY